MSDQVGDAELVAQIILGARGAPEKLYARLDPIIQAVARRRFKPPEVQDAVQEIYARLCADDWRVLRRWRGDAPLPGFIVAVAGNVCKDIIRRRRPVHLFGDDGDDPPEIQDDDSAVDPEAVSFARQVRECVERAINALSETYQQIIRLRHFEDLSHAEIAARLGKTTGYVGPTLMRAERYLSDEIRERCADHLGAFGVVVR